MTLNDTTRTELEEEVDESSPPQEQRSTKSLVRTIMTLILWYCISSSTVLITKWLFSNHFSFPLIVTFYSNMISTLWAFGFSYKLLHGGGRSSTAMISSQQRPITQQQFKQFLLPIGILVGLEIGCSNLALKILTVSFGTILKGMAPIFTFFWGLVFSVESFSWQICMALWTIACGIALASLGEGHDFQLFGFFLQLLSVCLAGLRWAITHKVLKGPSRLSPLTTVLYTAPITGLCVLPIALIFELEGIMNKFKNTNNDLLLIIITMTFIATLVFILMMSEYWLVRVTSSLALSVAAVFKELLTIGGGILFFSDSIDLFNMIGFFICQGGIIGYVLLRYNNKNENDNDSSLSVVDNGEYKRAATILSALEEDYYDDERSRIRREEEEGEDEKYQEDEVFLDEEIY